MDFGFLGLEGGGGGLVSSLSSSNVDAHEDINKQKWCRSEDDWREFKVAKNNHVSEGQQQQQQMLSFSSPNTQTLPYYTSNAFNRNAGYGNGGLNGGTMHGMVNGFRGPFAPSQWMELELQALIYKYITSNVPIPSYLLNPIRKALDSAGFSSFPGLRPYSSVGMGWGAFHLGFSNTDPEPGRCRRTDGKKWRCSRDAVVDQKYCERHINRGRHRSRKPVEGQPGTTISTSKPPVASTMPPAAVVVPKGGASNNLGPVHHPSGTNPSSASHQINRNLLEKANDISITPSSMSLKHSYSFPNQQNPSEESSRSEFGIVCSDSLLNPLNKSSSFNDDDNKSHHLLRQFMDDWPRKQSENSAISWANIDVHSERTQLSISTPMATSDYLSATSSPNNEKLAISPLRLLPELEATQMGLGVGSVLNEQNNREANWIPVPWQTSMGGPLGEVLHTNPSTNDYKNTSALNLMTDGWETSPRMAASSPTAVLHKTAFGSLSNSSAGSSPRHENNKPHEGATLCNNLLG